MSGSHDPLGESKKLIEAIDALVEFVRKYHHAPSGGDALNEEEKKQLLELDARVFALSKVCGLEIPSPQADEAAYLRGRPTFGSTTIHYFRRNELSGMAIRSTKGWFERMDQLRVLAVVTDECKPVERRPITDDEFRRFVELAKNLLQAIQRYASDDEYEEYGWELQRLILESPLAFRTNEASNGRSEAFANLSLEVAGAMDAVVDDLTYVGGNRVKRKILLQELRDAINRDATLEPLHGLLEDREPPNRIHHFGITLHRVRWQANRHGETANFAGKEIPWKLFLRLLRDKGSVVSHDELIRAAWSEDDAVTKDNLPPHITAIRKMINPLGLKVENDRKLGFSLKLISEPNQI